MNMKLILLASFIAIPVYPTISIGNNNNLSIDNDGGWGVMIRNTTGRIGVNSGQLTCDNCTGIIELTKGSLKRIIECKQGNCIQTDYNIWTGKQISPQATLNTPQMPQESTISGFFAQHPILAPALVGATVLTVGYGLYKLSKMVHKSKKR